MVVPGYRKGMEPVLHFSTHPAASTELYVHWVADRLAAARDSGSLTPHMRREIQRYWASLPEDRVTVQCRSKGEVAHLLIRLR